MKIKLIAESNNNVKYSWNKNALYRKDEIM